MEYKGKNLVSRIPKFGKRGGASQGPVEQTRYEEETRQVRRTMSKSRSTTQVEAGASRGRGAASRRGVIQRIPLPGVGQRTAQASSKTPAGSLPSTRGGASARGGVHPAPGTARKQPSGAMSFLKRGTSRKTAQPKSAQRPPPEPIPEAIPEPGPSRSPPLDINALRARYGLAPKAPSPERPPPSMAVALPETSRTQEQAMTENVLSRLRIQEIKERLAVLSNLNNMQTFRRNFLMSAIPGGDTEEYRRPRRFSDHDVTFIDDEAAPFDLMEDTFGEFDVDEGQGIMDTTPPQSYYDIYDDDI